MRIDMRIMLSVALAAIMTTPTWAQGKTGDAADAWLGVRVRPVPEALAAHLPLGRSDANPDVGLMVVNLVQDGPADAAGLQQYDVITHFAGNLVTDDLGQFVRLIGRHAPGEKVTVSIVRQGRKRSVAVTIGTAEPALSADYAYKYPEQPTGVFQQSNEVRGAVITRDADGWRMRDFKDADPAMFADLPADMRAKVMAWTGKVAPGTRTVVHRDGAAIEISRDATGRITVRRSARDEAGLEKAVTQTYADVEALKQADAEAYAIHRKIEQDPALSSDDQAGGTTLAAPIADVVTAEGADAAAEPANPDELARMLTNAELYREQIRDYEAFLEQYTEYLRGRLDEDGETAEEQPVPMMWRELLDRANARQLQPQREFKVDPSGRIDVRIRKDAGDLVISFRNEEEMAAMYPKLYQQYRDLVAGDE